jgi:hypothetical protein
MLRSFVETKQKHSFLFPLSDIYGDGGGCTMDNQAETFGSSPFARRQTAQMGSATKRLGRHGHAPAMPTRTAPIARRALRWISAAAPAVMVIPSLSDLRWLDIASADERRRGAGTDRTDYSLTARRDDAAPVVSGLMGAALARLDARTRHIVTSLHLLDDPLSLAALAALHGLVPDQVRQIDELAFGAVQDWMRLTIAERRNAGRHDLITVEEYLSMAAN